MPYVIGGLAGLVATIVAGAWILQDLGDGLWVGAMVFAWTIFLSLRHRKQPTNNPLSPYSSVHDIGIEQAQAAAEEALSRVSTEAGTGWSIASGSTGTLEAEIRLPAASALAAGASLAVQGSNIKLIVRFSRISDGRTSISIDWRPLVEDIDLSAMTRLRDETVRSLSISLGEALRSEYDSPRVFPFWLHIATVVCVIGYSTACAGYLMGTMDNDRRYDAELSKLIKAKQRELEELKAEVDSWRAFKSRSGYGGEHR